MPVTAVFCKWMQIMHKNKRNMTKLSKKYDKRLHHWGEHFSLEVASLGWGDFSRGKVNVSPASWEWCSRLQQSWWCCYVTILLLCTPQQWLTMLFAGLDNPPKYCLFSSEDLDLHLTNGSLGPPESTTKTASWSVQPFWKSSWTWPTDRQTDTERLRYSICSNRPIYLFLLCGLKTYLAPLHVISVAAVPTAALLRH